MKPLDRLRSAAGVPAEYSWAAVAITADECREIVAYLDDRARRLSEAFDTIADLRKQLADATPRRCTACGRGARQLEPVYEDVEGVNQITGWLGPSCWRKHLEALKEAAVGGHTCQVVRLPLGGER